MTENWRARSRAAGGAALVAAIAAALTTAAAPTPDIVDLTPLSQEAQSADGSSPALSLPEEVVEQAEDKAKIAELWSAVKIGEMPQSALRQATNEYLSTYGATSLDAAPSLKGGLTAAVPQAATASRSLGTGSVTQINNYYCGPAVAFNIANYKGKSKSAYNGAALSQKSLGASSHLNTDAAGATPWTTDRMRLGLNRWFSGSNAGRWTTTQNPSPTLVQNATVYNIDNGWPFAAETFEDRWSVNRYNNHPRGKTIGHWVTVRGYSSSGSTIHIADSTHSLAGWDSAAYYSEATKGFTEKFLATYGIVW